MATLTFKPTFKDRLFYDKYRYSMAFRLMHAQLLRSWHHAALDEVIEYRNNPGSYSWRSRTVDPGQKVALHNFIDIRDELEEHKIVLFHNHVYIYTNSQPDLEKLADLQYISHCYPTQAVINRPRDTILLTDPKYQYRTFLKERFLTPENMNNLSKFLLNRRDCFRVTDDLRRRLQEQNGLYTMSHYFVDHNDMKDLVMLQIVCPGIVRKTLTLQAK
jgi:hypothetical protein